MTERELMTESRRLGRPPLVVGDIPARVHITMPSSQYDKVHEVAKREEISVPEVIRRRLDQALSDEEDCDG
jgi:hypothetical protein